MAVILRNDLEKGPGYALLVFDRHIGATRLEIAIFHSMIGRYLGPSTIDKAHWQIQPSFALVAERVFATDNQSAFRVGPEVTTHIPWYSTVVVSTADGSINETVYWDEGLVGSDREDDERIRHEHKEIGRKELLSRLVPAAEQLLDVATQFLKLNETSFTLSGPIDKVRSAIKGSDPVAIENAMAALSSELQHERDRLKQKEEFARLVPSAEQLLDEATEFLKSNKTTSRRLVDFIDKVRSATKGSDPVALENAMAALSSTLQREHKRIERLKLWRARLEWLKAPSRQRAAVILPFVLVGSAFFLLSNTSNDPICLSAGFFCDSEAKTFRQVIACADGKSCHVDTCTASYRQAYPHGRFINQIAQIDRVKGGLCTDSEQQLYYRALACVTEKERAEHHCEVEGCFEPLLARYPRSQTIIREQARRQSAERECNLSQEQQEFDQARQCAIRQPCKANTCLADYRRTYPDGQLRRQLDAVLTRASEECPSTPRQPPDTLQISEPHLLREIRDRLYEFNFGPSNLADPPGESLRQAIREFERTNQLALTGVPTYGLLRKLRNVQRVKPWGSIAYGTLSRKWGISWNHPTRKEAVAKAHALCGDANLCSTAVSFFGGECGAFAHSGSAWSIATRGDAQSAREAALSECRDRDTNCTIVAAVCADGSGRYVSKD